MNRFLLRALALAGAAWAFGAMPAGAGERFHGGPAIDDLRGPHRAGVAQDRRVLPTGRYGVRPVAGRGDGERRFPRYGAGVTRADVAGLRLSHRLGARSDEAGYGDRFRNARYGSAAAVAGASGATHRGYRGGSAAPLTVGYGGGFAPSYGTSGNGYGSTGYGYGGDFSTAYTSGYDDFQTVGYATPSGAYGGQGYGAAPSYGAGGYGYGGARGWSPAIPPAGGLAVYSPGAYGPGPRIVTIPSHYTPGGDTFGCRCPQRRD